MNTSDIKRVTVDEWSTYCADYRTTASERTYLDVKTNGYVNSMLLRSTQTNELIGLVDYYENNTREYFIFVNREADKIIYSGFED